MTSIVQFNYFYNSTFNNGHSHKADLQKPVYGFSFICNEQARCDRLWDDMRKKSWEEPDLIGNPSLPGYNYESLLFYNCTSTTIDSSSAKCVENI